MKRQAVGTVLAMILMVSTVMVVAADSGAYVNPDALVSAEWLASNLGDPTLRVIATADCRVPTHKDSYTAGHVPGAVYLDVIAELSDPTSPIPMMILSLEGFEELMGRLGINSGTTVVVYDDTGGLWAARLWWALRYYGHEDVKLLDGGLAQWNAEGHPVETDEIAPSPTIFKACVVPELRATIDDIKLALGDPNIQLINALPESMFAAGHIPCSSNLPAPSNLDPESSTVLTYDDLTQLWAGTDLGPDQLAITYCGGGYFGAFDLFILYLMGHEEAALYDGSWAEWSSNPELPVEPCATGT